MAELRFNSTFFKKIESIVTPTMRSGLAKLSTKTAHWGIKEQGDLALIMGVLNFGDPDHRFLNNESGVPAPIPARPWLSNSVKGYYDVKIKRYINENLPTVLRGLPKDARKNQRAPKLSIEKFIQGLALVGRDNAVQSWDSGNFKENTPATLANKIDPRPLHDTGRMSASAITAWVD